jgi:hypothetical protein
MDRAHGVARELIGLPMVTAVALAGSRGTAGAGVDPSSDFDIYAYTSADIPREAVEAIVARTGGAARLDPRFGYWGPGDEWIATDGTAVDVVHFGAAWMEEQLDRVLVRHEPSLGYSTCLWHTIRGSLPLEDPSGWFARLQARAAVPYPDELRHHIVTYNRPVLRGIIPAYATQLGKAAKRGDLASVNHRLAGFLASYFDILFAVNRATHPGEKRLVEHASRLGRLPEGFADDVADLLATATVDLAGLEGRVDRLVDRLDALLVAEGFARGG